MKFFLLITMSLRRRNRRRRRKTKRKRRGKRKRRKKRRKNQLPKGIKWSAVPLPCSLLA